MTNTSGPTTPAGWYPDPAGSANLRWWDGSAWTAHLAPPPIPAPAPVYQAAASQPLAGEGLATAAAESYAPFQGSWNQSTQNSAEDFARPAQWNTGGVWFLAFSQVITLIAIVALFVVDRATIASTGVQAAAQGLTLTILVIGLGVLLLNVLFAVLDRRKLQSFGYLRPASVWWILLAPPLAYLIVRGIAVSREVRHGFGPLIAYIITSVGVVLLVGIGSAVAIPLYIANNGGAGSAYATQFTADLQKGLDEDGGHYSVACPPTIPTTIGAQFSCTATDTATNTAHKLNIEIIKGTNGEPDTKLLSVDPPITK